jgi:RNA polymerase sigma-70 factor (ECF subfamily)
LPTEEPESSLVVKAIQRDTEAFTELYRRYADRVYRYIVHKTGSTTESEDILSTVFLKAWRSIGRFRPKGDTSFAAWLFKLARNAVIDDFRRPREVLSLDLLGPQMLGEELSGNPETHLEWRMTVADLYRALETLTAEQREVVVLRVLEGLSARDVGTIMGKREGTVRGMQFRAIQALRRALDEAQGGRSNDGETPPL